MNNIMKLVSLVSLSIFLVSCLESALAQTGLVVFSTDDDVLQITFTDNLLETYDELLLQLQGINTSSKIAVLTSSTANLFYEIGIEMDAVPTSQTLLPGLKTKVDNNEVLTIGNAYQLSMEILTNLNPDVIFMADSLAVPDTLQNFLVISLPQSTYYDIFITLSLMESVFDISQNVQPILKQLAQDHTEAFSLFEQLEEQPRVAIVQSMFGQQLYNTRQSLVGSILEMMPVVNVFADYVSEAGTLNLELLLESNPDYIIVHGFGDNPDAALAFFLSTIRDENGLWQTLDAVKNNRIIVLGNALIGPSSDTRVTKAFLEISRALFLNEASN